MAALICDICGGNLVMDSSGEYALCESCGMKHTKERVRTKVQEIQGVVEVTKGEAEKERLLKNAETFINLNEEKKALDIYTQLTNEYPDEYRGWLGIAKITTNDILRILSAISPELTSTDLFKSFSNECGHITLLIERLNFVGQKISYLDKSAYKTVEQLEDTIISAYNRKGFHVNNPISIEIIKSYDNVSKWSDKMKQWASDVEQTVITTYEKENTSSYNPTAEGVLTHYSIVQARSDQFKMWADKVVERYINDYKSGKVSALVWNYRHESAIDSELKAGVIHPAAAEMCRLGLQLAARLKSMAFPAQRQTLRAWGVNDIDRFLTSNDYVYFVLGTNVCFYSGYGEYDSVVPINQCITAENILDKIETGLSTDMSKICEKCGAKIDAFGFCSKCSSINRDQQPAVCDKLLSMLNSSLDKHSLFTELHSTFGKSSFSSSGPWKNPNDWRTYSFSRVTLTSIELSYKDVGKEINIFGRREHSGSFGSIRYSEKEFRNVYMYMIRRNGKCQHCGSSFSGFFNKKCSNCGEPKDY